jgi:5-methylcytosine-specific restriction endonuclease McrA
MGAERDLARRWWESVAKNKPCAVCGRPDRVQGHHVVSQQAIKKVARRFGYDVLALLWDPRNGIPVCERCHSAHTGAKKRIPLAVIPASAFEFADELGLRWQIERDYPRLADAASA